jgi:hypothetical protein
MGSIKIGGYPNMTNRQSDLGSIVGDALRKGPSGAIGVSFQKKT